MKIISSNPWQPQVTNAAGKPAAAAAKSGQAPAAAARDDTKEPRGDTLFLTTAQPQRDPAEEDEGAAITRFLKSLEKSDSHSSVSAASQGGDSQGGFQIKSSNKGESVGQLAALLSRAETRLDVLQVSSKVTRILMDLKASAAGAKGDEAKKLARQIKRYEKLMKRIEKKLKHLAKEEQLELRRKRALKQMEFEKEEELRQELKLTPQLMQSMEVLQMTSQAEAAARLFPTPSPLPKAAASTSPLWEATPFPLIPSFN